MKLSQIIIIFFVLHLAASTASAAYTHGTYHGSNQRYHGNNYGGNNHGGNYQPWKSNEDCRKGYSPCSNPRPCNTQNSTSRCPPRGCNSSCVDVPVGENDSEVVVPPVVPSGDSGITTERLCTDGVCTVGASGNVLVLKNYQNATVPSYDQLVKALREDKTDEKPYTSSYQCGDFAQDTHNALESKGIKCAWIGCVGANHAINAVQTSDKGLIYFDCTGQPGGSTLEDKIVNVEIGKPLYETYLFKSGSYTMPGNVRSLLVYW